MGFGDGLLAKGLCEVCRSATLQTLLNVEVITFLSVSSWKKLSEPICTPSLKNPWGHSSDLLLDSYKTTPWSPQISSQKQTKKKVWTTPWGKCDKVESGKHLFYEQSPVPVWVVITFDAHNLESHWNSISISFFINRCVFFSKLNLFIRKEIFFPSPEKVFLIFWKCFWCEKHSKIGVFTNDSCRYLKLQSSLVKHVL